MVLKPGDKALAFALPDERGDKTCLSNFSGQKIFVYFYPGA